MFRRVLQGVVAGAAGTTALNAVTYADMAWRGRPASETPQRTVDKIAGGLGLRIRGDGATRDNRLAGLGALSGLAAGVAVGAAYGGLHVLDLRPPLVLGALLSGGGAMVATNASMARLGITDPARWSRADWLSDLLPHAAYGLVVAAVYAAGVQQ